MTAVRSGSQAPQGRGQARRRVRLAGVLVPVLALTVAAGGCASRGSGGLRVPVAQRAARNAPNPGIGVNAYLWRATLDTLAFMPLASADPYGGVVITDWYVNPEKADERFKATVYILDTRLRADGLNVNVFKQVKGGDGQWVDAAITPQTSVDIENAILTRARQVRLSNIGAG